MVHVVWYKRDLRTHDHRPLAMAAEAGPVVPLYIIEPAYWHLPDTSRRQWLALESALHELRDRLASLGAPLVVRTGNVVDIFARLHRAVGISRVLAHEETGNGWTYGRDRAVHAFCRQQGIRFDEMPQFGVVRRLPDRDQWAVAHRRFMAAPLSPEPSRLHPLAGLNIGTIAAPCDFADDGCQSSQSGTRAAGWARLESFLAGRGATYRRAMSSPLTGEDGCSRLSVSLSLGTLSLREVFHRLAQEREWLDKIPPSQRAIPLTALDSLVSRLHWHCHFIQKLESQPSLETHSQHPMHQQARQPTHEGDPTLAAWAEGRTGFPFVDACMRSLIATGWLNFRMRAMVMSFATYHLGLDWQASGTRLARLFSDYEPGIHWPQVQMQAGQTGINIPRLYNPLKQAEDHDPDGVFTRRWVPELARVPPSYLQQPWMMTAEQQTRSGCQIGRDYPQPLVDAKAAVRAARARLSAVRQQPGYREASQTVFIRHGSRKKQPARQTRRAMPPAQQMQLDL